MKHDLILPNDEFESNLNSMTDQNDEKNKDRFHLDQSVQGGKQY